MIEVATAIAGFSGIVATLGHRNAGHWTPADQLRLRVLLTASGATLVFGFLPFLLVDLFELSVVWRISSALYAIYQSGIATYRMRQLSRSGLDPNTIGMRPLSALLTAGVVAMLAANVVWFASFSVYLLGVLWGLLAAFGAFVALLLGAWRQPPAGSPPS